MDKRSRCDLLSDLPLSIIHSILAFVPIKDAVKTSILSRQWRYTWATLPHLVFDDRCGNDETQLNHFINQALLHHRGPIHTFKLSSVEECYTDQWVLFLSRNDVRALALKAGFNDFKDEDNWFQIHSSLYSYEKLTHLELVSCRIPPPPPAFNGFSSLRSLALEQVKLPCKAIESIVSSSPLLEELTLDNLSLELRIHAPNLKCLRFGGSYVEIVDSPLLSELGISLIDMKAEHLQQKSSASIYTKFLGGLTNIDKFCIGAHFLEYLSIGIESYYCSLVFHNLRHIQLHWVRFNDVKGIWVIVRLITGAPNLQKLHISCFFDLQKPLEGESLWDSGGAPSFTYERLKVIEMDGVCGCSNEMKFVEFLLENSPMLEAMIYKPNQYHVRDRQEQLMAELLRYRRASANAKILFG